MTNINKMGTYKLTATFKTGPDHFGYMKNGPPACSGSTFKTF